MESADAIILGSGQGGVPLAVDLAKSGKRMMLFERGALGGSCVNYGCTPSKSFLAAAHGAGRARKLLPLGVHADVRVDFPAVMNRVRRIRDEFESCVEEKLVDAGVRIVRAEAAFSAPQTVSGGGVTVSAPLVIINTGTTATVPDVAGLSRTPYLTNESFFELRTLPPRFLVMGGGYVGLELGQGMARAGSEVHVVDHNPHLLSREEPDVSEVLQKSFAQDGIHLHLGRNVDSAACEQGVFTLALDDGKSISGEALLVAVGRSPNTPALKCELGGIKLDSHGFVVIDDQFHTSSDGVYAIGDAAGQPAFTHVSWEDYRRLKAILAGERRSRNDRVLGYAVYTEPQVGRVGLDRKEAEKKGIKARSVTLGMDKIARAIEWGHDLGFYRMLIDESNDKIIGATLVGYEAAEIVHVILAHMEAKSTWQLLDQSVHIHPTYGEGLPSLARLFAE